MFTATRGGGATRTASPRPGRGPRRAAAAAGRHRLQLPADVRLLQAAAVARDAAEVRDIRRIGSAPSTCAPSPPAGSTPRRGGAQRLGLAAGGLVATEAGRGARERATGSAAARAWCAPRRRGFDEFRDLVERCGFLALRCRRTSPARPGAGIAAGARCWAAAVLGVRHHLGSACTTTLRWCTIRPARGTNRDSSATARDSSGTDGGRRDDMATDYDAPRKNEEDQSEESLEELKARRHDKNSGKVDEDEAEAAESFELPGADLSHEELAVEVRPTQDDEFTCMSCFLVHHRSQLADEEADLPRLRLRLGTHGRDTADEAGTPAWDPGLLVSVAGRTSTSSRFGGRCPVDRAVVVRRLAAGQHPGQPDRGAAGGRPGDGLPMSTSGCSGLAGGFLPVASFQVASTSPCGRPPWRRASRPGRAAVQAFEPEAICVLLRVVPPRAWSWSSTHPGRGAASARRVASHGPLPARAPAGRGAGCHQPVRRRVGRVGDVHPHRPAQVGPDQQVRARVGVAPGRPAPGLLGVQRAARRRGGRPGSGPVRRAAPRRRPRPGPRRRPTKHGHDQRDEDPGADQGHPGRGGHQEAISTRPGTSWPAPTSAAGRRAARRSTRAGGAGDMASSWHPSGVLGWIGSAHAGPRRWTS